MPLANDATHRSQVRAYCEQELARRISDFAEQAAGASLPLARITIVTPPSPEMAGDLTDVAFYLAAGGIAAALAEPVHTPGRSDTALAWPLCRLQLGDGVEEWFITPGGELRQSASREIATWPLEFYVRLSRFLRGAHDAELMPVDDARELFDGMLENALAGQPMLIARPVASKG